MGLLSVALGGFFVLAAVPAVFYLLSLRARKAAGDRDPRLTRPVRDAMKRLSANPRDTRSLLTVAEAAFGSEDYAAAQKYYRRLIDLSVPGSGVEEFEATLKHGIAAFKAGAIEEAYASLLVARKMNESGFEANYTLGCLEYGRDAPEKAAAYFVRALGANPQHALTARLLGSSLFRMGRHREAAAFLRKAVELSPDDRDALFELGQAYNESQQKDPAMKIFQQLRSDPRLGPAAALESATIKLSLRQYDSAVEDLRIGLGHEVVKSETRLELLYLRALVNIKKGDIPGALDAWKSIAKSNPAYKDVPDLIVRYGEINTNAKLQNYLVAPTPMFVTLSRRLAAAFFPRAHVKVLSVSVRQSEYVDIVCEVLAGPSHDLALYRFVRGSAPVGELLLRDMYVRLKELKGTRGICVAPASFTETATAFVEGRVLDLVDKPVLLKLLQRVPGP